MSDKAVRRFEYTDGRSNKYWEISIVDKVVITHWGRIGTDGAYQQKKFTTDRAAEDHYLKVIREKTGKGYVEAKRSLDAKAGLKFIGMDFAAQGERDKTVTTTIDQPAGEKSTRRIDL